MSAVAPLEQAAASAEILAESVRARLAKARAHPLVVGLCGAQGSGKSTITVMLKQRLDTLGWTTAIVALDDLYLPREERERLSRTIHPLLVTRGVPGTHDSGLGLSVLDALARTGPVALPRFDKAKDTRAPLGEWETVGGPKDVIVFEGWCVGARPQTEAALAAPVNALERDEDRDGIWRRWVNAQLGGPYQTLFARIDMLVLLAAPGFEIVSAWRRQQEHALREVLMREGRNADGTLDDDQIDRFILHCQRLTEHILAEMPPRADLVIRLDAQRKPVAPAKDEDLMVSLSNHETSDS